MTKKSIMDTPMRKSNTRMQKNDTETPRIIELPRILDARGNLSVIEQMHHIPFEIKRAYWIYDVPGGESRDGHAYLQGKEFIVALSGSLEVVIEKNGHKSTHTLTRSYYGLFIPANCWRKLCNFSTNTVALILSSTPYLPADYITDYNEFISNRQS